MIPFVSDANALQYPFFELVYAMTLVAVLGSLALSATPSFVGRIQIIGFGVSSIVIAIAFT